MTETDAIVLSPAVTSAAGIAYVQHVAEVAALMREVCAVLQVATSRPVWPLLRTALEYLAEHQWDAVSQGQHACPACGKVKSFGYHCRSCPYGQAVRRWEAFVQ